MKKSEIIADAIKTVKEWVSEIQFEDDFDLCLFMEYAGRLASLGDKSGIDALPALFDRPEYKGRIDEIVENRVKEGLWDLDEQFYEHLAHSIIEAQEFHSLAQHCGDILSDKSKELIKEWAEKASNVELDDEAAEFLEGWARQFPIDEDDQLAPVAAPMSKTQLAMIDKVIANATRIFHYTPEYTEENGWSCQVDEKLVKKTILPNGNLAVVFPEWIPASYPTRLTVASIPTTQRDNRTWELSIPLATWNEKNQEYLKGAAPVVFWPNPLDKIICKF